MHLVRFRGCLALTGDAVDAMAAPYLHVVTGGVPVAAPSTFHITLLSKDEIRDLGMAPDAILEKTDSIPIDTVFPLGVSRVQGNVFVPCVWPGGQHIRVKILALPPKDFHITLTATAGDHDIDKSVTSTMTGSYQEPPAPAMLDHLSHDLWLKSRYSEALTVAIRLCELDPTSASGWFRLGEAGRALQSNKLAMLAYATCWMRTNNLSGYRARQACVNRIVQLGDNTELGPVATHDELSQLPIALRSPLSHAWPAELCRTIAEMARPRVLSMPSRERLWSLSPTQDPFELHRFFSWIVPFHIAGSSTPRHELDVAHLASLGVRHVLTLTEEGPLPEGWFIDVEHTHMPVVNYMAPTPEQIDIFMHLATTTSGLLVHCGGGKGRAGTLLACYLVAFGFALPPRDSIVTTPAMSAKAAMAVLRHIRPGSIETDVQEAAISAFETRLWKRQAAFQIEPIPEPEESLRPDVEGEMDFSRADFLVLVGMPGSGKSWFSEALRARDPKRWQSSASGDIDKRSGCEAIVGRRGHSHLILDRCNGKPSDRKSFLDLASGWAHHPVAIYFDYSVELCTQRAQRRANHPSLPPGSRVRTAIRQQASDMTPPSLNEGFRSVIRVGSLQASTWLAQQLAPVALLKFPRTAHILNLGAATSDDLIDLTVLVKECSVSATASPSAPLPTANATAAVIVTEKIDGANLGFSLDADGVIRVQNRSHHVTSASHAQFRKLDVFLATHQLALHGILGRDASFPERYILFGEWMAATHSIPYATLPSLFVAFDLYDRRLQAFMSREVVMRVLHGTGIPIVPVICESAAVPDAAELTRLVHTKSLFYEGPVEGVYVKVESGGQVRARGKVVRADFIAGSQHWTKNELQFNTLVEPSARSLY